MPKVLLIDNYDSFTYNLYQFLCELKADVKVVKNDEVDMDWIMEFDPSHIVISPGPGNPDVPEDFGVCKQVILEFEGPILGVCLGLQGIASAFGGKVVNAPEIKHGMRSNVNIDSNSILFKELPERIEVMRYHSLMVEDLPPELIVTAKSDSSVIMAFEHKSKPIFGVQFHPESIGTPDGKKILSNFLAV